jgi:hypothetical protein
MKTLQKDTNIDNTKMIKPQGCWEPKTPCLSPARERGVALVVDLSIRQPVVTIDDLEAQAEKLLAGIQILKSYKYPLAVRRGVKRG